MKIVIQVLGRGRSYESSCVATVGSFWRGAATGCLPATPWLLARHTPDGGWGRWAC
jgi:hypothetical protein